MNLTPNINNWSSILEVVEKRFEDCIGFEDGVIIYGDDHLVIKLEALDKYGVNTSKSIFSLHNPFRIVVFGVRKNGETNFDEILYEETVSFEFKLTLHS